MLDYVPLNHADKTLRKFCLTNVSHRGVKLQTSLSFHWEVLLVLKYGRMGYNEVLLHPWSSEKADGFREPNTTSLWTLPPFSDPRSLFYTKAQLCNQENTQGSTWNIAYLQGVSFTVTSLCKKPFRNKWKMKRGDGGEGKYVWVYAEQLAIRQAVLIKSANFKTKQKESHFATRPVCCRRLPLNPVIICFMPTT